MGERGRRAVSEERCLNLGAAGVGVGEHEASSKAKGGAGGFADVAAGGDLVHEIGLAESHSIVDCGS